jgi:uncharacterized protein (TIGR03437 family)
VNNGSTTATTTVTGAITSPSFFVFDGTHITATHADGRIIGPTALYPGVSTPAGPNETIIVYTNGMGVTSVPIVSGSPAQSGNLPSLRSKSAASPPPSSSPASSRPACIN